MATSCLTVNDWATVDFIGGTDQVFTISVYDEVTGSPIDLTSSTCKWVLSPYGNQSYATLTLNGVISGSPNNHQYVVTISGSSTASLSGKFIQQPWIIDPLGQELRTSQGIVLISPRNG